jgi:hypothetical protein
VQMFQLKEKSSFLLILCCIQGNELSGVLVSVLAVTAPITLHCSDF